MVGLIIRRYLFGLLILASPTLWLLLYTLLLVGKLWAFPHLLLLAFETTFYQPYVCEPFHGSTFVLCSIHAKQLYALPIALLSCPSLRRHCCYVVIAALITTAQPSRTLSTMY